jgi:hypothetical protein
VIPVAISARAASTKAARVRIFCFVRPALSYGIDMPIMVL